MNYIKNLQARLTAKEARIESLEQSLNDFIHFLHSPKFVGVYGADRKDWISTGDVVRWIQNGLSDSFQAEDVALFKASKPVELTETLKEIATPVWVLGSQMD